jgi:hypothetical protein
MQIDHDDGSAIPPEMFSSSNNRSFLWKRKLSREAAAKVASLQE